MKRIQYEAPQIEMISFESDRRVMAGDLFTDDGMNGQVYDNPFSASTGGGALDGTFDALLEELQ